MADLERATTTGTLLGWVTAAAVILLVLALRRKGILSLDLFHEAFGGPGA